MVSAEEGELTRLTVLESKTSLRTACPCAWVVLSVARIVEFPGVKELLIDAV